MTGIDSYPLLEEPERLQNGWSGSGSRQLASFLPSLESSFPGPRWLQSSWVGPPGLGPEGGGRWAPGAQPRAHMAGSRTRGPLLSGLGQPLQEPGLSPPPPQAYEGVLQLVEARGGATRLCIVMCVIRHHQQQVQALTSAWAPTRPSTPPWRCRAGCGRAGWEVGSAEGLPSRWDRYGFPPRLVACVGVGRTRLPPGLGGSGCGVTGRENDGG